MVSINKSFLYGIGFASITWIISLSLYIKLTDHEDQLGVSTRLRYLKRGDSILHNFASLKNRKAPQKLFPQNRFQLDDDSPSKTLNELGLVKTTEDLEKKDEGYKLHAYNVLISEQLSYHREIPDTRNALCKTVPYLPNLPSASIIICFYNEHFQTLIRTIHSIVDRTPKQYLKEIILVDDWSNLNNLHENVSEYISNTFDGSVKLLKTERREGLIRARLFGARRSKGDVIVFLDSHVEVNTAWIEPLLQKIKENTSNVVMPVIDIINADTFVYTSSPLVRGGFNWGLHFKWENLPKGTLSSKSDFIKPIKSPTMAGGLFAMDRKYFTELGEYDAGMNIWGGENLEISFRIWMCGGSLEIIPCSRVGHVFRQRRPYGSPNGEDTMLYNSLRVAHVWMDSYKDYFLQQRPDAKNIDFGYIASRIQLRKELSCHDFDWYLRNIYPELALPSDNEERLKKKWSALENDKYQPWHLRKRNYIDQYQIKLTNTSLCIQSSKDLKTKGGGLMLKKCIKGKHQLWYETDKSEIVLGQLFCLQAGKPNPILYKCHEMGADQEWKHKGETNTPIYNIAAGTCLGVDQPTSGESISMKLCTSSSYITWDIMR